MQSLRVFKSNQGRNFGLKPFLRNHHNHSLPDYIRKNTPLLPPPCQQIPETPLHFSDDGTNKADVDRRLRRASVATGVLVGLPLLYLWKDVSDFAEFVEVIKMLPFAPIALLIISSGYIIDTIVYGVMYLYPCLVIIATGGFVFFIAYIW